MMKLKEIWRYPVKSMGGEMIDMAAVGPTGVGGDRQRAVLDAESGVSLSAKRYGDLMLCRAWTDGDDVIIAMPNGAECAADGPEASRLMSDLLNRKVIVGKADAGRTVRHEYPQDDQEETDNIRISEHRIPSFVDSSPLHLLTTASLREFSRLKPDSDFNRVRFRPNFFVEVERDGFVENKWVGTEFTLGEVSFRGMDFMERCIMTTRVQNLVEKDPQVLKTAFRYNGGNAGIKIEALGSGEVRMGDEIILSK